MPVQPQAAESFTVMVKPVGSCCNLECAYCYYLRASEQNPARMSDGVLESFIRQYTSSCADSAVRFVWHGGEPTLAGLDFYKRAVELQKKYLPEGRSCWNNLQTNGLLLDDAWCAFLAEARFDVGLSIDGAQWIHDKYRKDRGGGGTYRRAEDAVRRLQTYGIQPDLLCAVTSDAAKEPLAVYRGLSALGTGWIQFIPIVRAENNKTGGVTPDSVTGKAYGDFLCAVFDEWLLHDLGRTDVQLFAEAMRVWMGGEAGLCWMAPSCGNVLILERDGGVYSCDHFVNSEHRIGDIRSSALTELAFLPVQRQFGENKRNSLPVQCRSCPWLAVCNGGCPKDRFAFTADGEANLNHLCDGLRRFFSYSHPSAMRVASLVRQGQSPEAIMQSLRAQTAAVWKGVGRNDPCPCKSGRKAKHCCWEKRVQG